MSKNKNPIEIYDSITSSIEKSINRITQHSLSSINDENIIQEREKSLNLLNEYKSSIFKNLDELRNLSEWDVFTIAVYGETNAGKSTIIETLRIILGESVKREAQEKFREIAKNTKFDIGHIESLQKEIQQTSTQKLADEHDLQNLNQKFAIEKDQVQQLINEQQSIFQQKKNSLGFLQRIFSLFKKLEEERELHALIKKYQQIREEFQSLENSTKKQIKEKESHLEILQGELNTINETIQKLKPYEDGGIIGNGRSDFTLESQIYNFSINDRKFALIDVPGIEGNEKKVSAAINIAIKKAHAVLYITRKPSPPNKGEADQPGTVEKIRQHLGSHTEVWAVYNKGITNTMALQAKNLINEGEIESLKDLEKELRNQLGESYQGCINLSALPAFYSAAECILPTNSHYRSQRKFLTGMDVKNLQEKSNFTSFTRFISRDICADYKEKIIKSNMKKIRSSIDDGIKMLNEMIHTFSTAQKNLSKQHQSVSIELDNLENSITGRIKSRCRDQISTAKTKKRQKIYADIENDLSNDEFKILLRRRIDEIKDELTNILQTTFHKEISNFESDAKEIITRFLKNADEILEININRQFGKNNESTSLNFNIDNGINKIGLLSSLGGAAGLIWTAFLASNPAGWTVGVIVGAVALFFNFAKSVWGFFSSSYKMEQQRKSADQNLEKVFENIEKVFDSHLSGIRSEVSKTMNHLKEQLSAPLQSVQATLQSIQMANKDISQIAKKIA